MGMASALAVALALYWLGMSWFFHRQHQAQIQMHARLLKQIEAAQKKHEQLQARIEQRRAEILSRQKGANRHGDFWMPGELYRLRIKKHAPQEG